MNVHLLAAHHPRDPRTHREGLFQVEMVQGWDLVFVFFFRLMREDRMAATSFVTTVSIAIVTPHRKTGNETRGESVSCTLSPEKKCRFLCFVFCVLTSRERGRGVFEQLFFILKNLVVLV